MLQGHESAVHPKGTAEPIKIKALEPGAGGGREGKRRGSQHAVVGGGAVSRKAPDWGGLVLANGGGLSAC